MLWRLINCFLIIMTISACSKKQDDAIVINPSVHIESDDPLYADVISYRNGSIVTSTEEESDRFEKFNRSVFIFNEKLDFFLIKPVATIYKRAIPRTGRGMISNVIENLCSPLRMIYGIVTLDAKATSIAFSRFVINTTFGTLGLGDPASTNPALQYKPLNGNAVLKKYGGPAGDYIVLPVLGPSTSRGAFGLLMDLLFDPMSWQFSRAVNLTKWTVDIVNQRADFLDISKDIKNISTDEYAMTRSLYMQSNQ